LALPQQQQQAAQQYALAVSGHMQQAGMMISYTTAPHGARPMAIPMAIPQHLHSMPYAMQHATGGAPRPHHLSHKRIRYGIPHANSNREFVAINCSAFFIIMNRLYFWKRFAY
jgi:hypothetical protein